MEINLYSDPIGDLDTNDYESYTHLLETNIAFDDFKSFLQSLNTSHRIIVFRLNGLVIGTGTIYIETKLTYNMCKLGHIENILVHHEYRNMNIASTIMEYLMNIANDNECYRIDLACSDNLSSFYTKFDFDVKQLCMTKYFRHNFK